MTNKKLKTKKTEPKPKSAAGKKTETKVKKSKARKLKGVVVSTKMQKTIVVAVNKLVQHKKYKKRYRVTKKYKAHDEKEEYKKNDKVIIEEVRPISKDKTWRVIGLVQNYEAKPK